MLSLIVQNKWLILLTCEITSWIFTFSLVYFRYWYKNKFLFISCSILAFITGWVIDLILPFIEYLYLGSFKAVLESKSAMYFNATIIVLILISCIFGKKFILKVDNYFMNLTKKRTDK